jgi:OmpA-OmpF porin, OOP family
MNFSRSGWVAGVALGLTAMASHGQGFQPGAYLGGSLGTLRADDLSAVSQAMQGQGLSVRTVSVDDSDTGWKLFVGYRFNRYFAVEGGYTSLGEYGYQGQVTTDPGTVDGTFKADDWNAFAIGIVPLTDEFELFGKAGLGYWQADLAVTGTFAGRTAQAAESSGTSPIAGLGGKYDFSPAWGLRFEWERYFKVGKDTESGQTDIDLWSIGLQYRF